MKILALLIVLVACTHRVPTRRNDFRLIKQDGFLFSNIYVNPTELKKDSERIHIDYFVVVKNLEDRARLINLDGATITIGLRTVPIACSSHAKNQMSFSLAPSETMGIDCKIELKKQEGVFQIGDFKSVIQIPLEESKARFTYLLRAEDFE
ncbi:hypothetical protein [Peredibacter starrii]|uniref:Late embryogenesis abundant protein LEA-2 subgroup domain-containing protein n=1 Tax=Peredibacter starrii TaxID=28202 RepID=A0AAX4HSM5_9BACT|nr:hypothetical protein [Peredibacter starrii]WPU66232.1 hypothetical protein SOO65_05685 [Peredibacter starrii]